MYHGHEYTGAFITFEGIDFCGKSTHVELLKNYLISRGKDVHLIREPGGTDISEKIRGVLLDKDNKNMTKETEMFLFSASRAQLVREVIKPYLQKGFYVISDRFHDSGTAYQGYGRGLPLETIAQINNLAVGETIPDITFLIDVSVAEANSRKSEKKKVNKLDRIELNDDIYFERVREGFLKMAFNEPTRFKIIDGMKSIEDTHQEIIGHIIEYL
jgi:dTMP kinase